MKYIEVVNHPSLKEYFGERGDKWIQSLTALINKKSVGDMEVGDKGAEKLLLSTWKWSWLGFFFTFYWLAYHNVKYWMPFCIGYLVLNLIDIFFLDFALATPLSIVPAAVYGMFGRCQMLASKAEELSKTGSLAPPSWKNVGIALLIIMLPMLSLVALA